MYLHYFAHSLNLCVQEVTKQCKLLCNCMEFIFQLVQEIQFSPKRLNLFEGIRNNVTISESESGLSPSLRPHCPTRWTCRHFAIESILKNYHILMSSLDIIQQGHDEYAAKGKVLLAQMKLFDTFISLKFGHLIFAAAEQFSINLQAKDTTIAEGIRGTCLLKSPYTSLRTDASFTAIFYLGVLKASDSLTDEPFLLCYQRIPRVINEGTLPHRYIYPEDRYRHTYFEALEQECGKIEKQYDQYDQYTPYL